MEEQTDLFTSLYNFIRNTFFYDFRSSIMSFAIIIGVFFFFKLLKYDGEKPIRSLQYLVTAVICFVTVYLLYWLNDCKLSFFRGKVIVFNKCCFLNLVMLESFK